MTPAGGSGLAFDVSPGLLRMPVRALAVADGGLGVAPRVWLVGPAMPDQPEELLRDTARGLCVSGAISRSYAYPYALVAAHAGAVGVDIETVGDLPPAFASSIATPQEALSWAEDRQAAEGSESRFLTLRWSSKEALAKALGDPLAHDPRRLDSPLSWPGGRAGRWRCQQLAAPPGHVAVLVWADPVD